MFDIIRDVVDLFVAGAKFPADCCDEQQNVAYLGNLVTPAAGVMAGVSKLFHKHPQTDKLLNATPIEIESAVVYTMKDLKGWESLIPILIPFVQQLIEWIRKRRNEPKPTPDPFNS